MHGPHPTRRPDDLQQVIDGLTQQVTMLRHMLRDAIESKASAERALVAQQTRYEDLTQQVPWAVLRVRADGTYADVNRFFARLIGREVPEIVDQPIGSLGEPQAWVCALLNNESQDEVQVELTVDGSPRQFVVYRFRDRRADNFSVLALDQTERVAALAEAQRQAARADASNRAKSHFLAVMSHEIRTPLNGVLGMTELLEDSQLDGSQREAVGIIGSSGRALRSLVDNLLDLTKIEAGGIQLERRAFSPRTILSEVERLFASQAAAKGLALAIETDRSVPDEALGDSLRIQQVLTNLVSNAVKFTLCGEVRIELSVRPRPNGWWLVMRVTDTGIGIESNKLTSLFEPFTQADSSTTRRFGGTGLGLNISKGLAQAMGGDLTCTSRPAEGSEFTFRVPVDAPRRTTGTTDRRQAREALRDSLRGVRVLVAEDNIVNQRVAMGHLKLLGCDVECVDDGQQAVDRLSASEAFDVVLMDMEMPVMDGLSATRAIRRGDAGRSSIPIIAVTANAMIEQRDLCLEAGMTDYLSKPFTVPQLYQVLAEHTGAPSAADAIL